MNCQSVEDAIVEVGRGRDVGPGTAAAVDSHVEFCTACAARLDQERRLTAALRELAAASDGEVPSAALERRLIAVFAELQPAASARAVRWRPFAAAAAMLAAIAGVASWQMPRRAALPTSLATATPASPAPQVQQPPLSEQPAASTPPVHAPRRPTRPDSGRVVRAEGFVMLPAALGLPDFESGEIVRMELPLAALPAYGIEIVPDALPSPVEADLLIGQDGQARAIRLVTEARTRTGVEQ